MRRAQRTDLGSFKVSVVLIHGFVLLKIGKLIREPTHFSVCINNDRYEDSLQLGKLHRIIPDEKVESRGYLRVVDESSDDYDYSTSRFFGWKFPRFWKALARASRWNHRIIRFCLKLLKASRFNCGNQLSRDGGNHGGNRQFSN
jgi:hypothetical protein